MMKLRYIILYLIFVCFVQPLFSQMTEGGITYYGNEWINFNQSYYKIKVGSDGLVRVSGEKLKQAGIPIENIASSDFQLFRLGKEVPLYLSSAPKLGSGDFIEFFGYKNRGEMDRFLYTDGDAGQLNPNFSMFNDSSMYFLTWNTGVGHLRMNNITNDLTNLPPKQEYCYYDLYLEKKDGVYKKFLYAEGGQYSSFERGEGYGSFATQTTQLTLNPDKWTDVGKDARVNTRYALRALNNHMTTIDIDGNVLYSETYSGFDLRNINATFPSNQVKDNLQFKITGSAGGNDHHSFAYVDFKYTRLTDASNMGTFKFSADPSDEAQYFEITNLLPGSQPVVYDLTNNTRLEGVVDNQIVKFKLPPSTKERIIAVVSDQAIASGPSIEASPLIDYTRIEADYVIVSNSKLYNDGSGNNLVQQYADYRASSDGGGFKPYIVDIEQVYDQFGYGIARHQLALKNFCNYIVKNWERPRYIFIIGKGQELPNVRFVEPSSIPNYFVPTYGVPPSDNLLVSETNRSFPLIPVGRLPANNTADILLYFNKIKLQEAALKAPQTIQGKEWMKRMIFLSGGNDLSQQKTFRNYVSNFRNTMENSNYGAKGYQYYRVTDGPVEDYKSQDLYNQINTGVSLVTFLGHTGTEIWDFNIDLPNEYKNKGKYPFVFSMGCYSGNIHTSSAGLSERMVLDYGENGFIAHLAPSWLESSGILAGMGSKFFTKLGRNLKDSCMSDIFIKALAENNDIVCGQQYTYNGDPAIKIMLSPGPDLLVDESSVKFSTPKISIQQNTFDISYDLLNIGETNFDTVEVLTKRILSNGKTAETFLDTIVPMPGYRYTLKHTFSTKIDGSVGKNTLLVTIDPSDKINELPLPEAKANNELKANIAEKGFPFFIYSNSARTIYPNEFGIVNQPNVELVAYTADPLGGERKYLVQIDTTEEFNSALFTQTSLVQKGGIIRWQPSVSFRDSTVYYWRISPDSLSVDESFIWSNSSFIYLKNANEGWNQSHYWQYIKNSLDGIEYKPANHGLSFTTGTYLAEVYNRVKLNDNPFYFRYKGGTRNSRTAKWEKPEYVCVLLTDPYGEIVVNNYPPQYGFHFKDTGYIWVFQFDVDNTENRKKLLEFLQTVPKNDYTVYFWTMQANLTSDLHVKEWAADSTAPNDVNLFNFFEKKGATLVRELEQRGSVPYIFVYTNGADTARGEALATDINGTIGVSADIIVPLYNGNMNSVVIGPSSGWHQLFQDQKLSSNPAGDSTRVTLSGLKKVSGSDTLQEEVLLDNILTPETDISNINANTYRYLKLNFYTRDSMERTPAYLRYWRIYHDLPPDMAIDPSVSFSFQKDTLEQGQPGVINYAIRNLSAKDMDSVLVRYILSDGNNQATVYSRRLSPLKGNGVILDTFHINTNKLSGPCKIAIEANPDEDQVELYHFNNFLEKSFFVKSDKINPLLDVTFDGVHIMNGDIVSAKPTIVITLKDENKYFALSDVELFRLRLKKGFAGDFIDIPLTGNDKVKFTPADPAKLSKDNKATIEYYPDQLEDEEYTLSVQGYDVASNKSGDNELRVSFKVINKQMISNIVNYPNPFSTSTRFVYTLTGVTPPEYYKLQIFSPTGKVVREITQNDMGPLKIGTHITDYQWNGTDEYGDKLAVGVYYYKFVVQNIDGSTPEHYNNSKLDPLFKHEIGKLVIIR